MSMFRNVVMGKAKELDDKYIKFEDPEVFRILMEHGVSSDGIGITKEDAEKVTDIGTWFKGSIITSFDEFEFFNNVKKVSEGAFSHCNKLVSIIIPKYVNILPFLTFDYCTGLERVVLPDNISAIEVRVFENCTSLYDINLPKQLVYIKDRAFVNCKKISFTYMPIGFESFGTDVFSYAGLGKDISLPNTIKTCGNGTFATVAQKTNIYLYKDTPPGVTGAAYTFRNVNKIYIPLGSLDAYLNDSNWSVIGDKLAEFSVIERPFPNN